MFCNRQNSDKAFFLCDKYFTVANILCSNLIKYKGQVLRTAGYSRQKCHIRIHRGRANSTFLFRKSYTGVFLGSISVYRRSLVAKPTVYILVSIEGFRRITEIWNFKQGSRAVSRIYHVLFAECPICVPGFKVIFLGRTGLNAPRVVQSLSRSWPSVVSRFSHSEREAPWVTKGWFLALLWMWCECHCDECMLVQDIHCKTQFSATARF